MDGAQSLDGLALPMWLATVFRVYITVALPLVLILLNARLLMGDTFLRLEYTRPGFPSDSYGFSTEDRLTYAPLAQAYLFNDAGIAFLGDQTFPDGSPLYNQRELSHMQDVKGVVQMLTRIGLVLLVLLIVGVVLLALRPATHPRLHMGLLQGSILTLALVVALVVSVAVSFNTFFTQFHAIFFEGDSWLFAYSDTLIRLFPEQFWTDAFILVFGGAFVEALLIGAGAFWWGRRLFGS